MYEDLEKELDAMEREEIKQKLKMLLSEGKKCEEIIENLEQWEIDVIGRIYGTTSKNEVCSILVPLTDLVKSGDTEGNRTVQFDEKQSIKQKLKTLLYEGKNCEEIIENLEQWEIDVIGSIYGTNSKSKICSLLVKKLPLELIREVFLYSDPEDVISWEKSEFMDDRTFMRKKDSDLVKAAQTGNLLGVKYLIHKGDKNEALQKAAERGHPEVVKYLIAAGADIRARGNEALRLAVYYGRLEVVKYLLAAGVVDIHANEKILGWAARGGQLEVVKYLVEELGADVRAREDDALMEAARGGHLRVVKYLHKAGANIHARNNAALRYAADGGHLKLVDYLSRSYFQN